MNVRELIAKLSTLGPELTVVVPPRTPDDGSGRLRPYAQPYGPRPRIAEATDDGLLEFYEDIGLTEGGFRQLVVVLE